VQLIERDQLRQPIVIGHSIGGTIVLKLASLHPNLIGKIIVLDAAPRRLNGESEAERMKTNIALADELFAEADFSNPVSGARQWISEMVLDGSNVNAIASAWDRADRGTLKEFFVEGRMLALDLDVKAITVPVCVIAPFESEVQRAEVFQEFTEAYCGASSVEINMIGPARHFVMLDQPEGTSKVILGFCRTANR
jgi:pimeloyl-ACP methyl ester carboxylesterase